MICIYCRVRAEKRKPCSLHRKKLNYAAPGDGAICWDKTTEFFNSVHKRGRTFMMHFRSIDLCLFANASPIKVPVGQVFISHLLCLLCQFLHQKTTPQRNALGFPAAIFLLPCSSLFLTFSPLLLAPRQVRQV